ncbi:TlpA family protein disulfide reductase [Novipirellula sp. SH528]|uniref:TlpA family protein disulfide reductase n=1 Tax=Novipirellula sp. SH528 TaxID=3454466 RepID=UPI003F9F8781
MTSERTLLSCLMLLVICTASRADETRNFFVAPITTELHRTTVSSSADAYAIVNCNSLIVEGDLDLSALDEDAFLLALRAATATPKHLILVCRYQFPADLDTPLRTRLNKRLKELCASAGYQNVSLSETRTSADWKDAYHRADNFDQPEDPQEPLVENAHVRVFPVRTRLSKLVHGEADCIVEVIHPIDGRTSEFPSDLESAICQAVQATDLTEKQSMMFKLSSTTAGREKVEVLFDARSAPKIPETESIEIRRIFEANAAEYKPSPALLLAQELGFQKILYTHSPGGGAPETLVGAKAPNFKLTRLNGDPLDLHDFVLGRPALITFWGLACGPCRQEAPHLSVLHEKYEQGFSIIAVNGYNDARDAVAKYVKDENLTHPIALQGKSVSDDLYRVGAYPTTFWVDHSGTVIDYEVGFTSGKRLEDRIETLLKR